MSMPYIKCSNTRRSQAVTDVIESIALEECAIAHILNAEGEELQRVITFPNLCVDDIVAVNCSIIDVIKNAACLEAELKDKLAMFDHCLCHGYGIDDKENSERDAD